LLINTSPQSISFDKNGGTRDPVCSHSACEQFAKDDQDAAIDNADSNGYFAEMNFSWIPDVVYSETPVLTSYEVL